MTDTGSTDRRTLALGVLMPGFVGTQLPDWVDTLLRQGLGGVCLFGHNVDSPSQVATLTAAIHEANPNAVVSIDEEGGDVSRLHQRDGSPFPGNAVLGRIDDLEATRAVACEVGAQLAAVGVDLTLAPDVDVNSNPDNPVIGVRSFGADPVAVAAHAAAWTDGVQSAGVAACAKHFPGHGDTATDSHVSEPVVTVDAAILADRELVPFAAAIAADAKAVMTSHIRVPALDPDAVATFSPAILDDLLRERMGFDGVIVTDALDMVGASGARGIPAAAVAAVAAGADLLCLGSDNGEREVEEVVNALMRADLADDLPAGRLWTAADRCRALAQWSREQRRVGPARAPGRESVVDADRVAASFALSERAEAAFSSPTPSVRWILIDPEPNIAVGATPVGPFFEGGAVPSLVVPLDDRAVVADDAPEPGVLTLVVGRGLHRDDGALDAATTIARTSESLVIDMGFVAPGAVESGDVDIATFGASRLVGEALLALVNVTA